MPFARHDRPGGVREEVGSNVFDGRATTGEADEAVNTLWTGAAVDASRIWSRRRVGEMCATGIMQCERGIFSAFSFRSGVAVGL